MATTTIRPHTADLLSTVDTARLAKLARHADGVLRRAAFLSCDRDGFPHLVPATSDQLAMVDRVGTAALAELDARGVDVPVTHLR